jgi:mycoredoxin-dependent peroxiredoxin
VTVPANGTPAPDFTAPNQHGESITLSGLRGGPVLIIFYPWAFSSICRSELADVRNHNDEFAALGARLIAVSCDAMFTLRAFADQEGLAFDLVSDHWPHGAIADSYGVFDQQLGCALRGSFILDSKGKIIWQVVNQIGDRRQVADALRSLAA